MGKRYLIKQCRFVSMEASNVCGASTDVREYDASDGKFWKSSSAFMANSSIARGGLMWEQNDGMALRIHRKTQTNCRSWELFVGKDISKMAEIRFGSKRIPPEEKYFPIVSLHFYSFPTCIFRFLAFQQINLPKNQNWLVKTYHCIFHKKLWNLPLESGKCFSFVELSIDTLTWWIYNQMFEPDTINYFE